MNIEESVEYLKNCLNDEYNFKNATRKKDKEAIETLLTAYEKEKEKNKELYNPKDMILRYYDTKKGMRVELKGFVSVDKIKPIQIIDLDGKIHNVYKIEEE